MSFVFNPARPIAAQTFSDMLAPKADSDNETGMDARIQVLTRPTGALVFLEGEYAMAGRTPYTITRGPEAPVVYSVNVEKYTNTATPVPLVLKPGDTVFVPGKQSYRRIKSLRPQATNG